MARRAEYLKSSGTAFETLNPRVAPGDLLVEGDTGKIKVGTGENYNNSMYHPPWDPEYQSVEKVVALTQAEYDALTPEDDVFYIING